MFKTIKVKQATHGQKVDIALAHYLPKLSRRMIRRALDNGLIFINGRRERFSSAKVHAGDVIEIQELPKPPSSTEKVQILEPLVIYEDDSILAINKPVFVLSQKTKNKNSVDAKGFLISYLKEKKEKIPEELILCHRLDKETSGVLVFAKSKESCDWVMSQFKDRLCEKTYEALCLGLTKEKTWSQKNFLSTLKNKEQKVRVVRSGGKTALTEFTCLKRSLNQKLSHILCKPQTGRTHQIRVQLAHSKVPIIGDKKYCLPENLHGKKKSPQEEHHYLHAKSLKLQPSKGSRAITISAEAPLAFLKKVKNLG